jgi:hypothetical protein
MYSERCESSGSEQQFNVSVGRFVCKGNKLAYHAKLYRANEEVLALNTEDLLGEP